MRFSPIAIVGRACLLPGATSPRALYSAVREGRDLVSSAPAGRWRAERETVMTPDPARSKDRAWSDRGGFVEGFERLFDPRGFGLPEAEVLGLDPLFQWVLHTGREALREAGHDGPLPEASRARAGVVLGNLSFPSDALSRLFEVYHLGEAASRLVGPLPDPRNRFQSGLPPALLARSLGLSGPAFSLDAACASSLYAIKLACDRLHDGTADLMLAGAVNRTDDLFIHVGFCALQALSKTGRSRPFHREADGLLPAEGAAFVALKRLSDAVAAGDTIYGVIRGVGLSNDGRGAGLLSPSRDGQARALRSAYEQSGVSPSEMGLLECHATGTAVGDAAEIASMGRLYAGLRGVPIGSLKSNMGHLITVAGAAGLLKVLGAIEAGERPPTLHADAPLADIESSPFRLVRSLEPWPSEAPRLAAVSAFGFGGNNAHLIVEEHRPHAPARPLSQSPAQSSPRPAVAVVACAVSAAGAQGEEAFARALLEGTSLLEPRQGQPPAGLAGKVEVPLVGLKFPPRDLEKALAQQLLVLRTALDAAAEAGPLPAEKTSVLVGMGCDPEIARYGARWRLPTWALALEKAGAKLPEGWLEAARDSAAPFLEAAGVLGTMPNIPANRLNSQLDLGGPSFTVSAEELSGVRALEIGARALAAGEIDAAVVGAVEMACEPVHEAALAAVTGERRSPGDAAVVLILRRLDDAQRDGQRVLCVLGEGEGGELRIGQGEGRLDLEPLFGHAHAASGLLSVAAAVASLSRRALPAQASDGQPSPMLPAGEPRSADVHVTSFSGQSATVRLVEHRKSPARPLLRRPPPRIHVFSGESAREALARASSGKQGAEGPARLAIVARDEAELSSRLAWARAKLEAEPAAKSFTGEGVSFRASPIGGEVAFVFGGPASVYPGMGRDLLLAMPGLVDELSDRFARMKQVAGWLYDGSDAPSRRPVEKLWASSFLCQAHARLTRRVLGMKPEAAIGVSSGETNALFAMGAWTDLDAMFDDIDRSGLYDRELGGAFDAARRAWGVAPGEAVPWACYRVIAPVAQVRAALSGESRAHLTIIHAETDCVIGGDREACERVIARLGGDRGRPLGYDLVVHCPEATTWSSGWRALHRRPTRPVPGVRFYTHATGEAYQPTDDAAADALLGQVLRTVDFPALVDRAYRDGVRVFVEHGPQSACARWIDRALDGREHLAVSLDDAGEDPLFHAAFALAQLAAAGVAVDVEAFHQALASGWNHPAPKGPTLSVAAHPPRPRIAPPASPAEQPAPPHSPLAMMLPAPRLPRVLDEPLALDPLPAPAGVGTQPPPPSARPAPATASATAPALPTAPAPAPAPAAAIALPAAPAPALAARPQAAPALPARPAAPPPAAPAQPAFINPALAGVQSFHTRVAELHKAFVEQQRALHERFLATRAPAGHGPHPPAPSPRPAPQRGGELPAGNTPPAPAPAHAAAPAPYASAPAPVAAPAPAPAPAPALKPQALPVSAAKAGEKGPGDEAHALAVIEARELPGPKLDRRDLELLASGKISAVLGPVFAQQDGFRRQVRMPMPPLLLADRVTGITGEAGKLGKGTIWTETDVTWDAFYLHDGRMPPGIMIESGQADLLLISWMGADFENRGDRVYRLLGCELTYHGDLPRPGETLKYDIHIDGHAKHDDIRLFFFHYDCRVNGQVRLSVRKGQAGFFTDDELKASGGILWEPETGEKTEQPRLAPPQVERVPSRLSLEELHAFAEGRAADCFGESHAWAKTHVRSPSIARGKMMLLGEVTELDPKGGPWGRGYLKSVKQITPEDWFFEGHFKDDPCMPGTLMFEATMQSMAVYLAALGFTLDRDGYRFEPVTGEAFKLLCRGQVTPASRELTYELFVDELVDGPTPTLYADLLCTVDGLKAFHCRRMGFRLVPDWPMTSQKALMEIAPEKGEIAEHDGFKFDYRSLIACAWGKPSEAFGPMYRVFDGHRRTPRLPGPPYHFMSRVRRVEGGKVGVVASGISAEVEYEVPEQGWYFDENGFATMPYCVLLEAALQPCGWLASATGVTLTTDIDLRFRNLDGTATWLEEVPPGAGTLVTRTKLTSVSRSAGMVIVSFEVVCELEGRRVYQMKTVFGFFPKEALESQAGLTLSDEERAFLEKPSDYQVDLTSRPARFFGGTARLGEGKILMLDRLSGYWPGAGKAGLGRMRAEKDVDPGEWFFKAHFFQDPVQPGSLGIEAMIQVLQAYMLERGMGEGIDAPRFEPLAMGKALTWKYRGQVVPTSKRVTVEIEVTEVGRDEKGPYAVAESWLWADGLCIYYAKGLAMRMVPGGSSPSPQGGGGRGTRALPASPLAGGGGVPSGQGSGEVTVSPASDPWVLDHRPTYTVPALPAMDMVDRLARAAAEAFPGEKVVGLREVQIRRWVPVGEGGVRLRARVGERTGDEVAVELEVFREARTAQLSRFEPAATGVVKLARSYPAPPPALAPLEGAKDEPDPYRSAALFHGPAFQLLRSLRIGPGGSSATLDAGAGSAPAGLLGMALLDAATHAIPHDELSRWSAAIEPGKVGYPSKIVEASFHGEAPRQGEARVEVRFLGVEGERFPAFELQIVASGRVWCQMKLVEVLFDKGPLGSAPRPSRRAFLERRGGDGVGLGRDEAGAHVVSLEAVKGSDWLPGTVAAAYGLSPEAEGEAQAAQVAVKELVGRQAGCHPSEVAVSADLRAAVAGSAPLTCFPVEARFADGAARARLSGAPSLDLGPIERHWEAKLGLSRWPIADLYYGLARRFLSSVRVRNFKALTALRGRPVLFLANHQVGIESLLFSIVGSALVGGATATLAKDEHRTSWLGRLIKHGWSYPGVDDPGTIVFFDRADKESLVTIAQQLLADMRDRSKSVMVHVEGTRQTSCRTPVGKASSIWADLAMGSGAPIVPVRFVGGLQTEESERREFPVGYGSQEYWFGEPIEPERLAKATLPERRRLIVDGINAAAPPIEAESPLPGDPAFEQKVRERMTRTGSDEVQAVLAEVLLEVPDPSPGTLALRRALAEGPTSLPSTAEGRWLAGLFPLISPAR